jgi:hypothetical protein
LFLHGPEEREWGFLGEDGKAIPPEQFVSVLDVAQGASK